MNTVYDFSVINIQEQAVPLSIYAGKVLLIINVASFCGYTKQYQGLQALYDKLDSNKFAILAFPCNQFGSQEPGSNSEILNFCQQNFAVKFDLFSKIEVNGSQAHPLYKFLKKSCPGIMGTEAIKWNFTKFLIDKSGVVIKRFGPQVDPSDIEQEIISLLTPN